MWLRILHQYNTSCSNLFYPDIQWTIYLLKAIADDACCQLLTFCKIVVLLQALMALHCRILSLSMVSNVRFKGFPVPMKKTFRSSWTNSYCSCCLRGQHHMDTYSKLPVFNWQLCLADRMFWLPLPTATKLQTSRFITDGSKCFLRCASSSRSSFMHLIGYSRTFISDWGQLGGLVGCPREARLRLQPWTSLR